MKKHIVRLFLLSVLLISVSACSSQKIGNTYTDPCPAWFIEDAAVPDCDYELWHMDYWAVVDSAKWQGAEISGESVVVDLDYLSRIARMVVINENGSIGRGFNPATEIMQPGQKYGIFFAEKAGGDTWIYFRSVDTGNNVLVNVVLVSVK